MASSPIHVDKPVHLRCWCWQIGRCLVDCPTADHPRPAFTSNGQHKAAAYALMGKADCYRCGIRMNAPAESERAICSECKTPDNASPPVVAPSNPDSRETRGEQ